MAELRRLGLLLLGALGCAGIVHGADPLGGTYPVRVYRDVDGLPQNTVHAITLDQQGLLWIGTQDGAAVWDGRSWQTVPMPDKATSNFVRTILAGRDGSLWFGTQAGGLHRRVEGGWERYEPRVDGLPAARVNHLAELDGLLLVATHEAGIATFDGNRWQRLTVADGLPTDRVWRLAPGVFRGLSGVWAACEGGVVFVVPRTNQVITDPGFPAGHANSVVTVGADGAEVWVGTYGGGVHRFDGSAWHHLGADQGLNNLFVTSLAVENHEGLPPRVWAGTDGGGLARWDDSGRFRHFTAADGLPSDAVYSMLATSTAEGAQALWVGTRNGGLARVRELGWRALTPVPEQPSTAVTALAEEILADGSSALWFGTDGAGLVRQTSTDAQRWDAASGLPNGFIQALCVAGQGANRQVWVGMRNGGLTRIDANGRIAERIRAGEAIPHDLVQAIAVRETAEGSELWVGTREGLAIRRGSTWGRIPGLPPVSITYFEPSSDGAMWVGSSVGILRIEGERFSIIDQRDGLRNTGVMHLLEAPASDGERLLWVGTDGGGLALFSVGDTPRLLAEFNESSVPPLPNDVVAGLARTDDQTVFVLSNRGVAELSLTDPAVRYGPAVHVHVSGPEDGLPALAGNRAAILVDRQHRLWVGTVEGAASLDLSTTQREDRYPKKLVLRGLTIDSSARPVRPDPVVALSPTDRTLHVEFALLSYFREHDSRYRSQLIGVEERPGSWTAQSSRELTGLPPGRYTLQVQGRDFEGNLSAPLEIPIVVAADFWNTIWTHALPVLVVLVLAAAALIAQRRRSIRIASGLERKIAEIETPAQRARRALIACGLADPLSGIPNDEVLNLLSRRPTPGGASLVLFGLRDGSTSLADAAVFEEIAVEYLTRVCPDAEVGRFDVGVVWLWLTTADPHNPRRWLDQARADHAAYQTVGACGTAGPTEVAELPERIADAFAGARRTGHLTSG